MVPTRTISGLREKAADSLTSRERKPTPIWSSSHPSQAAFEIDAHE